MKQKLLDIKKCSSRFKIDDPVGCIGTHAVAGIWGMIAVGLFVEEEPLEGFSEVRGLLKGGSIKLLGVQILACVVVAAWAGFTTWLQLFLINKILPIRLSYDQEIMGRTEFYFYCFLTYCQTILICDKYKTS